MRHLLSCSFGNVRVKATFVSRNKIKCVAPRRVLPAVVDVDVSINGVDYTHSNVKLEYYSTCSPGSYCPDDYNQSNDVNTEKTEYTADYTADTTSRSTFGAVRAVTLVPCAPGHYCPSSRDFIQERCSRGTFQDLFHQTSCKPCPIGYECPYEGMSTPALCRAGYVCKVIGLALSTILCPPGHYCPAGTKTDITCIDATRKSSEYVMGFNIAYPAGDCVSGIKSQTIMTLHNTGYQYDQVGTSVYPVLCPKNTYCGPGVRSAVTVECKQSTRPGCYKSPQPCLQGYICTEGSETPKGTYVCPVGFFCPDGKKYFSSNPNEGTCNKYIVDAYDPTQYLSTNLSWSYDMSDSLTRETLYQYNVCPCPPGASCSRTGMGAPEACNPGYYSPLPGHLAECLECSLGHTCSSLKTVVPTECLPGWVCDSRGLDREKVQCIAGHYCDSQTRTNTGYDLIRVDMSTSSIESTTSEFYDIPSLQANVTVDASRVENTNSIWGNLSSVYNAKLDFRFQFPSDMNLLLYDYNSAFRIENLFKEIFHQRTNLENIEGATVSPTLVKKVGFSDPNFYWRATPSTVPGNVTMTIRFQKPLRLDAIYVYPTMPRFRGTLITEDLRCDYTIRVETERTVDSSGTLSTGWKTVDNNGVSVTNRFTTDQACRSYPRSCLANIHKMQRRLPNVVGPLCSLPEANYYNVTCTDALINANASGHLRLLRFKQFANQEGFEQFMTVPFDANGLPYNQTVLPGDPPYATTYVPSWSNIPGGEEQWHSEGLEYIKTIEVTIERKLWQNQWEAALTGIHIYQRNSTEKRPYACEEKLYCFDGVAQSGMQEQIFTTPQPCARGAYCKRGCPRSQGTAQCPTGEFCEKGTSNPIPVPEGQFAEGTGNPAGATCFAGTYTSKRGSSSCVNCPRGNYCPAITDTCWARNPNVTNDLRHDGFFARPTTGCETTNAMDLTIQDILVSNAFDPSTGTGYKLGSTPKESGRNDTIICKAGFICSQTALSSVTQTCDRGHYCLEGTFSSANTTQECTADTHCSNVLKKGRKAATKFPMVQESNVRITATTSTTMSNMNNIQLASAGVVTWESTETSMLGNLLNGNMPNICPRWVTKDIPPTQTTSRYRGTYDGCYSYDGFIVKGVSDVRIELYINTFHREPTGDPLTNLFQSQDPQYMQYIGKERPVKGSYCRSDIENNPSIPCVTCGLTTDYGECPSLDEIGLAASTAIYNELATQSPSKINVWYVSSEEAYYMPTGDTRAARMAPAKIVLATSYRGAALLKNMFTDTTSIFNLTLQLNHTRIHEYLPRLYSLNFLNTFGGFSSRGPWEDFSIDITNQLTQGLELASTSGMWRAVLVEDQYPYRVQDSRLSVEELCTLDTRTPGDVSLSPVNCLMNWTGSVPGPLKNNTYDVGTQTDGNRYSGLWRAKETLAYVDIQDITPTTDITTITTTTYLVRTRASEGVLITGHYYLWIGEHGQVPTDNNGVVDNDRVRVHCDASAVDVLTLLTKATSSTTVNMGSLSSSILVTRNDAHAMYGLGAKEWRVTFSNAWRTQYGITSLVNTGVGLRVEYRRPLVWPRQEWIFGTFHSGGDGYEPTLLGESEPLRGLPPSRNVFVSDGEQFYKHDTWNTSSYIQTVTVGDSRQAEMTLHVDFLGIPQNISYVRLYPYFFINEDVQQKIKKSIDIDPRTHQYSSAAYYTIHIKDSTGRWRNVTKDGNNNNNMFRIPTAIQNSSSDLVYFDHRVPRGERLPESLNDQRTTRTFANNSWWFDLPLLQYTELNITLYSNSDLTPGQTIPLGLSELEIYTRTEQYVPGSMVMAIAAKSEDQQEIDRLNNMCCRNAIRCPAGSYCLAGAAHGALFTSIKADAHAATGGKDFEAPQMGIAGNYYADGTDNPLGTGQCPKGYYCPPGTSVPRPCWRGFSCSGAGVVKPTVCPTGTYGNVGVPAYTYGWESLWPLAPEAKNDMADDLSLMYYNAMRNVLARNSNNNSVVLPTKLTRFWNGMDGFIDDFPQRNWALVQGYGNGFANGVRSVLIQNNNQNDNIQLRRNYTAALLDSKPCFRMNVTNRALFAEQAINAASSAMTVPGVKDLSPRRAATFYPMVYETFHTQDYCNTASAANAQGAETDTTTFSTEAWIAPNNLSSSTSHVFLSTANRVLRTGWELRAQQYQEGYRWSCHVENRYATSPLRLSLFHNSTNGTLDRPLRANTLAKDLKIILEGMSADANSPEEGSWSFGVYVMGIEPDDTICTSGNTTNRTFVIHFYDVTYTPTSYENENQQQQQLIRNFCMLENYRQCRKKLKNDTVLNLGETSGRTIFNVDWNILVVGAYDADFTLIHMLDPVNGTTLSTTTLNAQNVVNQFSLEVQHYHRWEYGIFNGTHENIITGPRISKDPETGTHVTGTAFQTFSWHHVVLSYDSARRETALVVDLQENIDLYYVTSDYLLSLHNVNYAPTVGSTFHIGDFDDHNSPTRYTFLERANNNNIDIMRPGNAIFHVESVALYNRQLTMTERQLHYYAMLDQTMGQDSCTPCKAGEDCQKSLTSDHIVVPSPCATGKYRNQASTLVSCSRCPEGRYSLKRGLKHYTECQQCPEGLVCEVEGANDLEYRLTHCFDNDLLTTACQASLCPEDAVCGMGTKKETMLNVKCPPGYYCTWGTCTNGTQVLGLSVNEVEGIVNTVRSQASWYTCPVRYFCGEGTTFSTKTECTSGMYCPQGSAMYCCTPSCKANNPEKWMSQCDAVSLQSSTLEADLNSLSVSYPFVLDLPLPSHLRKTCTSGTSSLRKAGSENDCFIDWSKVDQDGPSFYIFPFQSTSGSDQFIHSTKSTPPRGTTGNASWVEPTYCNQKQSTQNNQRTSYYNVEDLPRIPVPASSIARFTFDFTNIPERLVYDDFYRISIFIDSGESGRSSTRVLLPQRFFNMVNDDKARMFTEGRSSTEDVPAAFPNIRLSQVSSGNVPVQYQQYVLTLTNARDRPLGGYFAIQIHQHHHDDTTTPLSKTTQSINIPANCTANDLQHKIIQGLMGTATTASTNKNVSLVNVTRQEFARNDAHAGYIWKITLRNDTKTTTTLTVLGLEHGNSTLHLSKERIYTLDVLVRKAISIRVALEVLHENVPEEYLFCRQFVQYLTGTAKRPVATVKIQRPSRFHYGEPVQTGIIISRAASDMMHLPANLPMNNSECVCSNFSSTGCTSKDLRKDCELPPYGTEFDMVMPDWGRLDSDPLRPTLASHEKSVYWAYSEFSVEKVKLNSDIGRTMDLLKKEVTVQLRGRYRSALASTSAFSNSDKRLYFERHSNYITMPYFPFFSNCKGFSTRIAPFELFENKKECDLTPPNRTIPVEAKNPTFFSSESSDQAQSTSDSCHVQLECIYDEIAEDVSAPYTARIEDSREKYWFALTQDDTTPPFYMTYDPMASTQMLDLQPRPSETTLPYWMNRKELIPVKTYRNRKYYGLSQQYAPKNVTFEVKYWQETNRRKHIVSASLTYDNFWRPDFCGGTNEQQYYPDCSCGIPEYEFNSTEARNDQYRLGCTRFEKRGYYLNVNYVPMNYVDLFNATVFPSYVYFTFFVGIAILLIICISMLYFFYVLKRRFTNCIQCCVQCFGKKKGKNKQLKKSIFNDQHQDFLRFNFKSFMLRSQMPGTAAFVLHTLPFLFVTSIVGGLVHINTLNLFWNFPGAITDVASKCFPPFSPIGGALCREALKDDGTRIALALTRFRFVLGPLSLWYIRKGVRLICPAESEYERHRFLTWRNAPENVKRLSTVGKDMETKRNIANEINERKRELIPSGGEGIISSSDPIYKKRSHLWMYSVIHVLLIVFVVGWSRWKILQQGFTFFGVLIGLKLLKIPYERYWLKSALREYWLMTPFLLTWNVMEFLVMLGSPTLLFFLVAFSSSMLYDCLKRIFLDPMLLRYDQIFMSGRRKKVHGRDAYDTLMHKHNTWREILFGFEFTSKEQRTLKVQKFIAILGKEGVLRDMISSTLYVMTTMYTVFILLLFYVLYDEMAIEALYGVHQVHLTTYVWFSLVMMVVVLLTDYLTTTITEMRSLHRNRRLHLHRLAPNGYLWQRDLFTCDIDMRIDDSLRSLDTLNFTMQYYYGILILTTGMILGGIFIFAYCSVADASTSENLLTSLISPLFDLIADLMFVIARGMLAEGYPIVEKMVVQALVDLRKEELDETPTLGSRMRNRYRVVCKMAMREQWTKEQFVTQIKQATNEMIKNEIEREEGKDTNGNNNGLDDEAVKDVLFNNDENEESVGGGGTRNKKLSRKVRLLLTNRSSFGRKVIGSKVKSEDLIGVEHPEMFLLPPEADSPIDRGNWRTEVMNDMYGF